MKIDDTGYLVNYIETFLSEYYSSSIIMQNNYTSDVHNTLIKYLVSPEVVDHNLFISRLKTSLIDNNDYNIMSNFSIKYRLDDIYITTKSTSNIQKIKDWFNSNVNMSNFKEFIYNNGWKISKINIEEMPYTIVLMENGINPPFIKRDALKMVNYFTNKFIYNKTFINGFSGQIENDRTNTHRLFVMDCEPNTKYCIGTNTATFSIFSISSSILSKSDIKTGTEVRNQITDIRVNSGEMFEYETGNNIQSIIIESLYHVNNSLNEVDSSYIINDFLILQCSKEEIGDLNNRNNSSSSLYVPTDIYCNNPWTLNDRFMSFITGHAINPNSNKEDIYKIQKYINKIYNKEYIEYSYGIYDNTLRNLVKRFQIDNNLYYCDGYVCPDTELKLRLTAEGV